MILKEIEDILKKTHLICSNITSKSFFLTAKSNIMRKYTINFESLDFRV
jgi:hypothetical protein